MDRRLPDHRTLRPTPRKRQRLPPSIHTGSEYRTRLAPLITWQGSLLRNSIGILKTKTAAATPPFWSGKAVKMRRSLKADAVDEYDVGTRNCVSAPVNQRRTQQCRAPTISVSLVKRYKQGFNSRLQSG